MKDWPVGQDIDVEELLVDAFGVIDRVLHDLFNGHGRAFDDRRRHVPQDEYVQPQAFGRPRKKAKQQVEDAQSHSIHDFDNDADHPAHSCFDFRPKSHGSLRNDEECSTTGVIPASAAKPAGPSLRLIGVPPYHQLAVAG
jgi:hypothetical protein